MKYVKQFSIIAAISFAGEWLHEVIPFPVPASIYGLVLMLALLGSGILKIENVKEVSAFLIEVMPVMFIPAAAGLINSWDMIRPRLLPYIVVTVVSLVVVIIISGRAAQFVIKKEQQR